MIIITRCPVCESSQFTLRYPATFTSDRWEDAVPFFLFNRQRVVHGEIRDCSNCGFVFTARQFTPAEYAAIYSNVPGFQRPGASDRYAKLQRLVLRFCSQGHLLDLGCGDGHFLKRMSPKLQVTGIDSAPLPAEMQGSVAGFVRGDLQTVLAEHQIKWRARFDVVTGWDLLEHLPDLNTFLELCHEVTAPRGLFFCTVPDINSAAARVCGRKWNCLLLEHLWFFDRNTLTRLLQNHGFEPVEVTPFWFPTNTTAMAERMGQTYGPSVARLCRWLPAWDINLPVGLIAGVFRRQA